MTNNSAKHQAHKLLLQNKLYTLTNYRDLQCIIESKQVTIVPYHKHTNSAYVSELIQKLHLENEIAHHDAFLFLKNNLRFLFIHSDISNADKSALLRHELGHICDPYLKNDDMQASNIKKEEFANEFSCYLKNPGIGFRMYLFLIKKWKWIVGVITLLACILGLSLFMHSLITRPTKPTTRDVPTFVNTHHTYYVTSAGKKYHLPHCIVIKYKSNLTEITLNDAINDGYTPCQICQPKPDESH